jgi:hypothetical protein
VTWCISFVDALADNDAFGDVLAMLLVVDVEVCASSTTTLGFDSQENKINAAKITEGFKKAMLDEC